MVNPLGQLKNRLKMRHLQLLSALGEEGSLRKAAASMALTQPAVTKLLHELEDLTGEPLFTRTPHGLLANELGHAAIRYARLVYTDLGSLHEEMVALRSSNMGKVRMGGLGALTGGLLPMTVTQIKQSHPKLTLSVLVDTSDILVQALHLDQLDFLVARIPQEYQWDDLEYEPLGEEIIQIAARASHPAIHADNLTLESLTRYPWVVHCRPTPLREIYHQVFREALVQAPLDIVESASTMLGVSLLLHTDMVTLMPKMLLDYYSSLGILARIPLELSAKLTPYGLIRRKNRPMTPAMQLVIDTLRENARLLQELNHPAPWQVEPATGLAALPG